MRAPHRQLPPVDDSVVLPKAVRDQMARSAAAQEAAKAPTTEPTAEPLVTLAPAPTPAPPTSEAPPAPAPVAPVAPTPAPTPAPQGEENWEHKYNSLKGRYDRQEQQLQQLSGRLEDMSKVMATMSVVSPDAPPTPKRSKDRLITPKDETEYGSEFIDVVKRAARDILNEELEPIDQRLDQFGRQVQSVTQVTTLSARDRMEQDLTTAVPNWRVQNNDPRFLAWLRLPDVYSGAIRGEMLRRAYEANEAHRVIAFFKGFLTDEAAADPQATTPAPVTPEGNKPSLEDFAAPGRARTAAPAPPTGPTEKPIISRAEISAFYRDVAAHKYRGREEEQANLEKQIFEAQAEGRIR